MIEKLKEKLKVSKWDLIYYAPIFIILLLLVISTYPNYWLLVLLGFIFALILILILGKWAEFCVKKKLEGEKGRENEERK